MNSDDNREYFDGAIAGESISDNQSHHGEKRVIAQENNNATAIISARQQQDLFNGSQQYAQYNTSESQVTTRPPLYVASSTTLSDNIGDSTQALLSPMGDSDDSDVAASKTLENLDNSQSSLQPPLTQEQSSVDFSMSTPSPDTTAIDRVLDISAQGATLSENTADADNDVPLFNDNLLTAPRFSAMLTAMVAGIVSLILLAGVVWWSLGTVTGQQYDDMVWQYTQSIIPAGMQPLLNFLNNSKVLVAVSSLFVTISIIVLVVRKRWSIFGQLIVFAVVAFGGAEAAKYAIPRPVLDITLENRHNTLPSGHTAVAMICALCLVMAVSRAWRAPAAVLGMLYVAAIGMSLLANRWHRPSDIIAAMLWVSAVALFMLAATRGSGMDPIGKRKTCATLQIVGTAMITLGVLGVLYAMYVIWQLTPGLALQALWARPVAVIAAGIFILSASSLLFGVFTVLRQVTAAPLTKAGLIGAPPTPPAANPIVSLSQNDSLTTL